jgi:ribonucleotide reductase beta subunit family protein with ferritin-like domain
MTTTAARYTVFPIQHPDLWEMFLTHKRALWTSDEVDLSHDGRTWATLAPAEQQFIKMVLAFFAASDGIVMENLAVRFFADVPMPEARAFYAMQLFIENEHAIMYAQLIETYILDAAEKDAVFRAMETDPAVKAKADWALRWIDGGASFAERLLAFICIEGIFFSGSFCCIYWVKERGILPGLVASNDFIARDENLHCLFGIRLYTHHLAELGAARLAPARAHAIVGEAVRIEKAFITAALPQALMGMNAALMAQYIEFVANGWLARLGYAKLYPDAAQPFPFMERIALENQTHFFEERVSNYQKQVRGDAGGDAAAGAALVSDADF